MLVNCWITMVNGSISGGYTVSYIMSIVKWVKIGDTQPTNRSGVHFIRVGDGGGWVLLLA